MEKTIKYWLLKVANKMMEISVDKFSDNDYDERVKKRMIKHAISDVNFVLFGSRF